MAANSTKNKKLLSKEKVQEAATRVQLFWQVGYDSLKKRPDHYPSGRKGPKGKKHTTTVKEKDAAKLDSQRAAGMRWTADRLRLARTFANNCSPDDLDQYLQEALDGRYPIGRDAMIRVFEVSSITQRQRLWKHCLANRLTKAKVLAAKRRLLGGNLAEVQTFYRKLDPPRTAAEAKDMLQEAAARFQRVCDAVDHPDKKTLSKFKDLKPDDRNAELAALAKKSENGSILSKMSREQRKRVIEVRTALKALIEALGCNH